MVELEVLNKKEGFTKKDQAILLGLVQKYPFFDLAQEKLLLASDLLKIESPVILNIKNRKNAFSKISNSSSQVAKSPMHYAKSEEMVANFLKNYLLPHGPSHFICK